LNYREHGGFFEHRFFKPTMLSLELPGTRGFFVNALRDRFGRIGRREEEKRGVSED